MTISAFKCDLCGKIQDIASALKQWFRFLPPSGGTADICPVCAIKHGLLGPIKSVTESLEEAINE